MLAGINFSYKEHDLNGLKLCFKHSHYKDIKVYMLLGVRDNHSSIIYTLTVTFVQQRNPVFTRLRRISPLLILVGHKSRLLGHNIEKYLHNCVNLKIDKKDTKSINSTLLKQKFQIESTLFFNYLISINLQYQH